MKKIKLGINAVRIKSGGGISHIKGIIEAYDPKIFSFSNIHLWCNDFIANQLCNYQWLKIHVPNVSSKSTLKQLYWERFTFKNILKDLDIDILFNVDAGTISNFSPSVTLSQDMLSYEPGEIKRYGISKERLRLIILRYVQNNSLKNSTSAIFLTKYGANLVQKSSGKISQYKVIPHGIDDIFKEDKPRVFKTKDNITKILYVSNTAPYKHQWHVVKAIGSLIRKYPRLKLELVGGGAGNAQKKLMRSLKIYDPKMEFTTIIENQPKDKIAYLMRNCDIFLFASSCESISITLLEAMASKVPIACSNRGPLPSVLKDGGLYFNPEDYLSIARTLEKYLKNKELCILKAKLAKFYSDHYTWSNCSNQTFRFIESTFQNYKIEGL